MQPPGDVEREKTDEELARELQQEEDERAAPLQRQQSTNRLMRATSAVFTSGAAILPTHAEHENRRTDPPDEGTPLRAPNRREEHARIVHERRQQEVAALFQRSCPWMCCLFIFLFVIWVTGMILLIWACYAFVSFHDKPCDQPFKYYILASLVSGMISVWLQNPILQAARECCSLGPYGICGVLLCLGIPGWLVIAWGMYMTHESKTCSNTNPDLYYPTMYYIYFCLCTAILYLFLSIVAILGVRQLVIFLSKMNEGIGCEKAVKGLPRVDPDAAELVDPEDGKIMDCAICVDSLGDKNMVVVRCPCKHHFHEECLAEWCKNHSDCPLCREVVGDLDQMDSKV